jgi:hypothetical protein
VMYKLLERMILQRIQPLIKTATPVLQSGFRKHRSYTEQVMVLTKHIEASFQRQLETEAVFVVLSTPYHTLWRDGLILKFMMTASFKGSSEVRAADGVD